MYERMLVLVCMSPNPKSSRENIIHHHSIINCSNIFSFFAYLF